MKTHRLPLVVAGLITAFLITGCGQSDTKSASTPSTKPAVAAPSATAGKPAPTEGRAVEIHARDTMKFDIVEITAKPGEALAVTLINKGTMPKFSMGHNWVLLAAGVDINAFATASANAVKTDYVPDDRSADVIASTKLLGPNESSTARFYAPKQPGRYEFLCTFPGHFQVGMKGVLIVR